MIDLLYFILVLVCIQFIFGFAILESTFVAVIVSLFMSVLRLFDNYLPNTYFILIRCGFILIFIWIWFLAFFMHGDGWSQNQHAQPWWRLRRLLTTDISIKEQKEIWAIDPKDGPDWSKSRLEEKMYLLRTSFFKTGIVINRSRLILTKIYHYCFFYSI